MKPSNRREQKIASRKRILQKAAKLFRKQGLANTGVDQVMKASGLTVGGFYNHFDSKNDLIAESLGTALDDAKLRLLKDPSRTTEIYLSPQHRDRPEEGCVIAALASELPQQSGVVKRRIESHLESWVADFTQQGLSRAESLEIISRAVGALILSRIVDSEKISNEILKTGRNQNLSLKRSRSSASVRSSKSKRSR
jgi:TetR/AcrR family transcriptional regulator, transcriptional repressor for nem operon